MSATLEWRPGCTGETRPRAVAGTWVSQQARVLADAGVLCLSGSSVTRAAHVDAAAWSSFAAHWDRLVLDRFMGDGGNYRLRRYGALACPSSGPWLQLPHAPYRQPHSINRLNGGIDRLFEPLEPGFVHHSTLRSVVQLLLELIHRSEGGPSDWKVELHPYRILASAHCPGQPTPEGLHRDGVDYTAALMVRRANIRGARTRVVDTQRRELRSITLRTPLDLLLLDDVRTLHEVSAIEPRQPDAHAWRDVLVLAFTRQAS